MTRRHRPFALGFSTSAICLLLGSCWDKPPSPDGTLSFGVRNTLERDIFVQEVQTFAGRSWFRLDRPDGALVIRNLTCGQVECGESGNIACERGIELPRVKQLNPGEAIEQTWDGYEYVFSNAENCFERQGSSGDFRLRMCWGFAVNENFDNQEVFLEDCITREINLDGDVSVSHTVDSVPPDLEPPAPVELQFSNQRSQEIVLESAGGCFDPDRWFRVLDGGEELALSDNGFRCADAVSCSQDGFCDPAPRPPPLPPECSNGIAGRLGANGGSTRMTWPGIYYERNEQEGCFNPKSAFGQLVDVQICFGDGEERDPFTGASTITNRECVSSPLEVGSQSQTISLQTP